MLSLWLVLWQMSPSPLPPQQHTIAGWLCWWCCGLWFGFCRATVPLVVQALPSRPCDRPATSHRGRSSPRRQKVFLFAKGCDHWPRVRSTVVDKTVGCRRLPRCDAGNAACSNTDRRACHRHMGLFSQRERSGTSMGLSDVTMGPREGNHGSGRLCPPLRPSTTRASS